MTRSNFFELYADYEDSKKYYDKMYEHYHLQDTFGKYDLGENRYDYWIDHISKWNAYTMRDDDIELSLNITWINAKSSSGVYIYEEGMPSRYYSKIIIGGIIIHDINKIIETGISGESFKYLKLYCEYLN